MEGDSEQPQVMQYGKFYESKWRNFLTRYKPRLEACKLYDKASSLSFAQLQAYFEFLKPFLPYFASRDVESLVALFEVSDFGDKDVVLQQFRDLQRKENNDEYVTFWRYVDLFLGLNQ